MAVGNSLSVEQCPPELGHDRNRAPSHLRPHRPVLSAETLAKKSLGLASLAPALRDRAGALFQVTTLVLVSLVACLSGCQSTANLGVLPNEQSVIREQLIVHTNFHLPKRHRLLDELVARRTDISQLLELPTSDEPINVYLFEDQDEFYHFVTRKHPTFPNRRALFVKNDTALNVFAYWGDRVAEDLRHEVTHGYVHSVVPAIPLWLDEGIAEYFEVTRGRQGFNPAHIYMLANRIRRGEWVPNLMRLEELETPESMLQVDYAESWLWVHFLLDFSAESRELLQRYLNELKEDGSADSLWPQIQAILPDSEEKLVEHLRRLSEKL